MIQLSNLLSPEQWRLLPEPLDIVTPLPPVVFEGPDDVNGLARALRRSLIEIRHADVDAPVRKIPEWISTFDGSFCDLSVAQVVESYRALGWSVRHWKMHGQHQVGFRAVPFPAEYASL